MSVSAVSVSLPVAVSSALSGASVVGFSGSRSLVPAALFAVVSAVPAGCPVFVGCARDVDGAVRSRFPSACVFRVSGSGRGAFAARSVRFVRRLSSAGGVLFSFPGRPCPVGLVPAASSSACFCGLGSGSWASLAFALGLGVPCCVWLPAGVSVPASWGLVAVGGGWWVSVPF
ncbi:hypothetical protein [Myxosarcina sp. GI1(2024)]